MHFDLRIDPRQSTAASHIACPLPDRLPLSLSVLTAVLAALPALLIVLSMGPVPSPDTNGYLAYAAELRSGLPQGDAVLRQGAAPPSLYRAPGYPALLAILGPTGATLLPIALFGLLCSGLAVLAFRLGLPVWLACLSGILPGVSMAAPFSASLLPDGMVLVLSGFGWLALATAALGRIPALTGAGAAGLLFAVATLFREATPYIALFSVPLALIAPGRWRFRLAGAGLVVGLPVLVMSGMMAWNHARAGVAVTTTSRQVVMVQALLPLLGRDVPLYAGGGLYDRIARESLGRGEYSGIGRMNERLFAEAGMAAPEMSAEASRRYGLAWRSHPVEMLRASVGRFDASLLATPFDPAAAIAVIAIHSGMGRPKFDRLTPLMHRAKRGDVAAIATILAVVIPRTGGLALGLLALAGPPLLWLRRRDQVSGTVLGLWAAGFGIAAVYLPVHIEPRYLLPLLAITPLLAATLWLARKPAAEWVP